MGEGALAAKRREYWRIYKRMKAKLVSENIRFERGRDPKDAMDIGLYHPMDFKSAWELGEWMAENVGRIIGKEGLTYEQLKAEVINIHQRKDPNNKIADFNRRFITTDGDTISDQFLTALIIDMLNHKIKNGPTQV